MFTAGRLTSYSAHPTYRRKSGWKVQGSGAATQQPRARSNLRRGKKDERSKKMLTVTLEQLKEHSACTAGLKDFESQYGSSVQKEWTLDAQMELLKTPLRRWFGWAVDQGFIPMWSMQKADLSEADLGDADLRGANLSWTNI